MSIVKKILKEYSDDVLNKTVRNSKTGRDVKISSALSYDPKSDVYKKAMKYISQKSINPEVDTEISKPNTKSHKPKSKSYGISKDCVDFLKSKGLTGLNVLPQSFVKVEEVQLNPKLTEKNRDTMWVAKFPVILPNGNNSYKTAYTKGFMKKSQVKKYKKISKISNKDITTLEEKLNKLITSKDKTISDGACVLKIILNTGLRIGSVDNNETGNLGVRTLKNGNVTIDGDKVKLSFLGKSYQENIAEFTDPGVVNYLTKISKNKKPTDNLFNVSYSQVGEIMDRINTKKINPKDIRTYKATEYAKKLLQAPGSTPPPLPTETKAIKKSVQDKLKTIFERVAIFLNNSPAMARNSYVHPVVITDFLDSLGLVPKAVGYKHITLESKTINGVIFTSMDEMFEKYKDFGNDIDTSDINEEEMYDCEEYPLPDWWDNDEIELIKK